MAMDNRRITEGVIWKQLLLFFFPILLGSFFQQMYNTVDTVIVGRFVGTGALAAVGASGPILSLINGFFLGVSTGATVILSQFCGASDRDGISKALHTGIALALALGVLIMVLGMGLAPRILQLIGTPESCMADAVTYCRILFGGAVFSMLYNMGSGILRAMGDSRRPMIFLIVCCAVNIAADLLLVWGLDLGVAGAAIATVAAQAISAVLVLFTLLRQKDEARLELKKIRFHGRLLGSILRIGIPAGIQLMMFDFSNLIVQSSINSFGEAAVAAWVAFGKADGITWMISGAFGVSVTTFVGQNFGAQKYDRMRRSVWICMGFSVSLVGAWSVLEFIFREPLLGLFTTDPAVIAIGAEMMTKIVLFNAVFMPIEVFAGTMRGTGYALAPTVIMCLSVCLVRILWVSLVVSRFHTIGVLCLAYPVSWILCASVFAIVYFRGNWLRSRIAALGMEPEAK
jgi:putative MATE family efflux protein